MKECCCWARGDWVTGDVNYDGDQGGFPGERPGAAVWTRIEVPMSPCWACTCVWKRGDNGLLLLIVSHTAAAQLWQPWTQQATMVIKYFYYTHVDPLLLPNVDPFLLQATMAIEYCPHVDPMLTHSWDWFCETFVNVLGALVRFMEKQWFGWNPRILSGKCNWMPLHLILLQRPRWPICWSAGPDWEFICHKWWCWKPCLIDCSFSDTCLFEEESFSALWIWFEYKVMLGSQLSPGC